MYKILSLLFYLVAALSGLAAGYTILIEMFPEYGILHLSIGLAASAMFFPLIPLYPGFAKGQWIYAIICYISIMLGVIVGNKARKLKN